MIDATETADIFVRARDCRKGTQGSPERCAVAIAAKRDLGAREVRVYATRAYAEYPDKTVRYALGSEAQQAIRDFDGGRIAFGRSMVRLDPIPESQRSGVDRSGGVYPRKGHKDGSRSRERAVWTTRPRPSFT